MAGKNKLCLSVITADVGGFIGNVSSHPEVLDTAKETLDTAKGKAGLRDFHVLRCGDDLALVITHEAGCESRALHEIAWKTFISCRDVAIGLKLYGTGHGLSKDGFTGTLLGMGPGVAEMEFVERESESIVIFLINKAATGPFNLPFYKIFADPFNTAGLILDKEMSDGFSFRIRDLESGKEIRLSAPGKLHEILALAGSGARYVITGVAKNSNGENAASVSAQKIATGGGEASHSEPTAIVRCQAGFPTVGEVMEAFAFPHLVSGWLRGAHNGPLLPVPFYEANPTRFDGPPRIISAGFQIADGRLLGPHDMFDDPSFDETRRLSNQITEYIRRHGPFEPHRLPEDALTTSNLPATIEALKNQFQ
ncbi:MAG: fructose 1,6-bisphosphatase [Deltaproteobacteria bacterium]|nr:fructose 1,6-bisphosphatase [Deltaproteobacteria bacterium]